MEPDEAHWREDTKSVTTLEYLSTVTDYISIPLCAITTSADILLIIVILKYKRLKTRTNFYLIHFAIFHILYIISAPVLFYTVSDLFFDGLLGSNWNCVWMRVENFAMGLAFTFIAGFGVDSFLEKVKPSWFSKYKERYAYAFSFFYFGHFIMYLIAASICLRKGFANNFNFYFLSIYYFIVLLCVLYVTHYEHKMEKNLKLSTPNKAFALTISVIILLMWMPLIVFYNLMVLFKNIESVEHILWYTLFLPEYLAYCCSLVVIYELWKSNKHFKSAFLKVFRRPVSTDDIDELNINIINK